MPRGSDIGKHPNALDVTRRMRDRNWLKDFSSILNRNLGRAAIITHLEPSRLTLLDRREMARTLQGASRLNSFPVERAAAAMIGALGQDFCGSLPARLATPEVFRTSEAGGGSRYYLRIPFINPRLVQERIIPRETIDGVIGHSLEWATDPSPGVNVAELAPAWVGKITVEDLDGLHKELPPKVSLRAGRIAGKLAREWSAN